jgi:hypothetical protein
MLVGQAGEKKVTPPPAQPAPVPAATSSACCNSDPCGCESFGHRLRHKLGGLFQRDNCNSCQPTCCDNNRAVHHRPAPSCNDCGGGRLWTGGHHNNNNNCAPTCTDSCGRGGFNLLGNLRHRFGRNDCGCDGGCGSTVAPAGAPVKQGEKIDAPKKMPVDPPTPKKTSTEVRFESTPIGTPATVQPLPTPPAVEVTPVVPVPRVEGDRRDPF